MFRSVSGQLLEIRKLNGVSQAPKKIECPQLIGDPNATIIHDGRLCVVAQSRRGLIVKVMSGQTWKNSNDFSNSPPGAADPTFALELDKLLLIARSLRGNFLMKSASSPWIDTGVQEAAISQLVRLKSGNFRILSSSWLGAVVNGVVATPRGFFSLAINSLSPNPPLFEGDQLEVNFSLTNSSPNPATGDLTAALSSNVPTWYSLVLTPSGPSPKGLAPGATLKGSFKLSDYQYLAAGVVNIGVRYVSYQVPPKIVRLSFYGPGLGPEVELGGVVDYIAADSLQEKVWRFDEPFPTDDIQVSPGPASCSAGEPDLSAPIRSYNFVTLCRTVQAVEQPRTIKEAAAIVMAAVQSGIRLRVIGNQHSANAQLCTDGKAILTTGLQGAAPANSGFELPWMPHPRPVALRNPRQRYCRICFA